VEIQGSRRFIIENLGCAKNQVDAEVMISHLEAQGWTYVEDPEQAELIIVNSCGFIQTAKEESIQVSVELKKRFPGKKILMAGCFAQRNGGDLMDSLPEVDGFFGNQALSQVGFAADEVLKGHRALFLPGVEEESADGDQLPRDRMFSYPGSAFIKISEGCGNNCSYCAIPLLRGGLRSRTIGEVTGEIEALLSRGYREFNFVGQDLGSFGTDRGVSEFPELLKQISRLSGDFWIRLLYMHPDHFPLEILEIMKNDPRILPYFDIPFQHGSERILKKMGRRGNAEKYLELLGTIRSSLPDAVIRSTFLVGFPGETGRDMALLEDFQGKARLDWLGVFSYSREEGTRAAELQGELVYRFQSRQRDRRRDRIMKRQQAITESQMDRFVGRELPVLIEEAVEGEELFIGRTFLQAPDVDGLTVVDGENLVPGTMVPVRIIRRNGLDLEAVPVKEV
jgi:ribosomal protein S12 methylthiotransferase